MLFIHSFFLFVHYCATLPPASPGGRLQNHNTYDDEIKGADDIQGDDDSSDASDASDDDVNI